MISRSLAEKEVTVSLTVNFTHPGAELHFVRAALLPDKKTIHVVVKKIDPEATIINPGEFVLTRALPLVLPEEDYHIKLYCLNIQPPHVHSYKGSEVIHLPEYRYDEHEPAGSELLHIEKVMSEDQSIRYILTVLSCIFYGQKLLAFESSDNHVFHRELMELTSKVAHEQCDLAERERYEVLLKRLIKELSLKSGRCLLNSTEKSCYSLLLEFKKTLLSSIEKGDITQHQLELIYEHTNLNLVTQPSRLSMLSQSLWSRGPALAVAAVATAAAAAYSVSKLTD